jgi:hypothetical protein
MGSETMNNKTKARELAADIDAHVSALDHQLMRCGDSLLGNAQLIEEYKKLRDSMIVLGYHLERSVND